MPKAKSIIKPTSMNIPLKIVPIIPQILPAFAKGVGSFEIIRPAIQAPKGIIPKKPKYTPNQLKHRPLIESTMPTMTLAFEP